MRPAIWFSILIGRDGRSLHVVLIGDLYYLIYIIDLCNYISNIPSICEHMRAYKCIHARIFGIRVPRVRLSQAKAQSINSPAIPTGINEIAAGRDGITAKIRRASVRETGVSRQRGANRDPQKPSNITALWYQGI